MSLTIRVILCAYNEERFLPACLASLTRQTRPPDEIIVVNNASTDGTRAVAASTNWSSRRCWPKTWASVK